MAASLTTPDVSGDGRSTYETKEWSWLTIPGEVGARDRSLLTRLARRRVTSTLEHHIGDGELRLKVTGAVGVLDLEIGRVVIRPKFMDEIQLLRLVQAVAGLRNLEAFPGSPTLAQGTSLPDLLAELLVRQVRRLLQGGLRAGYVAREEAIPALRGRFLADRQQMDRFGLLDRLICRFEQLDFDVFDNQLLIDGLAAARSVVQGHALRMRVGALEADLLEVAEPADALLRFGSIEAIRHELEYDRLNERYRLAHEICLRLIEGTALHDDIRPGESPTQAFLIETAPLFESFVEASVRQALPEWSVSSQTPAVLYRQLNTGSTYTAQRPDLLATSDSLRIPIDAKYKRYSLTDGSLKVSPGDLNQIYAYSQSLATPAAENRRGAALVFPKVEPGQPTGLTLSADPEHVRSQLKTYLQLIAIHVPTALDELDEPAGPALELRRLLLQHTTGRIEVPKP